MRLSDICLCVCSVGVFPNWDKSVFAARQTLMRNAALTNIAPTGTISMMFDISGGTSVHLMCLSVCAC